MRDLRWLVFIPYCWGVYQLFKNRSLVWSTKTWFMICAGLSAVFFLSAITKFTAYEVNGLDFSAFDWMLHNTIKGQFMWSPFCNCNHFGVHPTWLFLSLLPLHAIWQSPWLLVLLHAISLAISLPLMKRLIRIHSPNLPDAAVFLILAAMTTSQAMGSINNYGFHPETWYLPIGLWFLCHWSQHQWRWLLPAFLFAAVKEDGALFLASWAFASFLFKQVRTQALVLMGFSALIFVVNTKLLQPLAWPSQDFKPSWSVFWAHYGSSPAEIVLTMLRHPITTITDMITSGSWHWFLPFAFLPLFSWRAFMGMLPGIVMLSLANSPVLRGFGVYYAAPILPFAFFGWLIGLKRCSHFVPQKYFVWVLILFISLLGFVGGVGPRLGKQKPDVTSALNQWLASYDFSPNSSPTCLQTALYPHVGYRNGLMPLLDAHQCTSVVVDSRIDPYPFQNKAELLKLIEQKGWKDLANP